MQIMHGSVVVEIMYLIKHIIIGIAFYVLIEGKNCEKFRYNNLLAKNFIVYIIPYVLVVSMCNFIVPDHFMLLVYFALFFIYYFMKEKENRDFFSNSILVISIEFIIIVLDRLSSFTIVAIGVITNQFNNIPYDSELVLLIHLIVFSSIVLLLAVKGSFNPTIIRNMMKHRLMAISQVVAWALAITLSIINDRLSS